MVFCIIIGGSAGLRMMIALPRSARPRFTTPAAVVRVNSSMLWRVPGPAERDDTVATISAYGTGATRDTAQTIGMVAWPPQVTMFTFISLMCSVRLAGGITYGPIAAGVRSTARMPASRYRGAFLTCTWADVASNTTSGSSGWVSSQSTPSWDASRPFDRASASPSLAGSTPIIQRNSSASERRSLNIRSVPMLPDPTIAAVGLGKLTPQGFLLRTERQADITPTIELGAHHVARADWDHPSAASRHNDVPRLERDAEAGHLIRQPRQLDLVGVVDGDRTVGGGQRRDRPAYPPCAVEGVRPLRGV